MKLNETESEVLPSEQEIKGEASRVDLVTPASAEDGSDGDSAVSSDCELTDRVWSVVSFDGVKAGDLTYDEAVKLVRELDADRIPGLCIISDSAASRIKT